MKLNETVSLTIFFAARDLGTAWKAVAEAADSKGIDPVEDVNKMLGAAT